MPRPKSSQAAAPYPPGWEPFLVAIRANMDEDTPRLVFADWLQENGDEARAEFIRVQCDLARAPHGDPANATRHRRIDELLNAHWNCWVRGLPRWVQQDRFRHQFVRGFLASVTASAGRFLKDGDALTGLTALLNLEFTKPTAEALRSPFIARVGGLYLDPVDSASVAALAHQPDLSLFRHLHIGTGRDSRGLPPRFHVNLNAMERLLANPTLTGLKQFTLTGPPHGETVARGIAACRFTSLEQLDLVESRLTNDGLKAIVTSTAAGSLRGLYIAGNRFGDAGIRHMVEAPALTRLECLNVIDCGLSAESAKLLAEWPGLRTVRWLQLGGNGLTEADADLIRHSPHSAALTDLNIRP